MAQKKQVNYSKFIFKLKTGVRLIERVNYRGTCLKWGLIMAWPGIQKLIYIRILFDVS